MQPTVPVTLDDLLAPVQSLRHKFEVFDGADWLDLYDLGGKCYVKKGGLRLSLGGAGMSPDPIAGTWSAEIHNEDGIFHPFHPTSEYADLFRIGRAARISLGGMYPEQDPEKWLVGWAERKRIDLPIPDADLVDFPVKVPIIDDAEIGALCRADGFDIRFTKDDGITLLTYERESFSVTDDEATGIFWVKTDVATAGTHIWCYYGNPDAPDVSEIVRDPELVVNGGFDINTNGWIAGRCSLASIAGGQKGNCLELTRTSGTDQYAYRADGAVSIGVKYRVSTFVKSGTSGNEAFGVYYYDANWANGKSVGEGTSPSAWTKYSNTFIATTGTFIIWLTKLSGTAGTMLFDTVSVKIFHSAEWSAYEDAQELLADGGLTWGDPVSPITRPAPYYWQRLIGYMDAPRFEHGSRSVSLSGLDYMKRLADTVLRYSAETAGPDDEINGPTHWGRRAVFDSVASPGGDGNELYAEEDACEIGAGEDDNVTNWEPGLTGIVSSEGPAQESLYFLQFVRETAGPDVEYVCNSNVANVTADTMYRISFWAKIAAGQHIGRLIVHDSVSYGHMDFGETEWKKYSFIFLVTSTGNLHITIESTGEYADIGDIFQVDNISIQLYDATTWMRYELPPDCNGPYFIELDNQDGLGFVPIGQGDQEEGGWHYVESVRYLFFSEKMHINAGTDNLRVYYYTTQDLDDVLADLLVEAGYYVDRATALGAMNYTPTEVSIPRVWFDPGPALAAVKLICERVDYRFWFDEFGVPHFQPAPTGHEPDFVFTEPKHIQNAGDFQDVEQVRNRIVIEGAERVPYQVEREDKVSDRYKGEAFDQGSIDAYLEKTHAIQNHLFQDQDSIDAMTAALLAEYRYPKWYATIRLFGIVAPLELGDVIEWPIELEPSPTTISIFGIIRDIKISDSQTAYSCEIIPIEEHGLLSILHPDTEPSAPLLGDMILAGGGEPAPGTFGTYRHDLLSEKHDDTVPAAPETADVIMASGDPVLWKRLPAGEPGQVFEMGLTIPGWGRAILSADIPPIPEDGSDGDLWFEY